MPNLPFYPIVWRHWCTARQTLARKPFSAEAKAPADAVTSSSSSSSSEQRQPWPPRTLPAAVCLLRQDGQVRGGRCVRILPFIPSQPFGFLGQEDAGVGGGIAGGGPAGHPPPAVPGAPRKRPLPSPAGGGVCHPGSGKSPAPQGAQKAGVCPAADELVHSLWASVLQVLLRILIPLCRNRLRRLEGKLDRGR